MSLNKIALWIRVDADVYDWTAERTSVASNDSFSKPQIQFMYFHLRMELNITLIYVSFVIQPNSGLFTESFNRENWLTLFSVEVFTLQLKLYLHQYRDWSLGRMAYQAVLYLTSSLFNTLHLVLGTADITAWKLWGIIVPVLSTPEDTPVHAVMESPLFQFRKKAPVEFASSGFAVPNTWPCWLLPVFCLSLGVL